MHARTLFLLSLPLLAPELRAQTAPATPPPAPEGTSLTLGRYEVAASKFGAQSAGLLTSVTVVGADQLEHESADYTLELLGKIPGVTLTDFNQGVITADVSLRGFNGEGSSPHLRLLIDGLPANLNSGNNDLGPVFPLEIERVEVVKGPVDPRYGLNAVAGTVSVHTFQAYAGQKLKLMAGDFGLQETQALAGYRTGGFAQTYFAGYRRSDGYRTISTTYARFTATCAVRSTRCSSPRRRSRRRITPRFRISIPPSAMRTPVPPSSRSSRSPARVCSQPSYSCAAKLHSDHAHRRKSHLSPR